MGVHGLETYISEIKKGTSRVDIRREISDFKQRNQNKSPIIVIDFNGFHCAWQSKQERLCGLRANVYMQKARAFFQKLKDAGAELVFFIDGPIQAAKSQKWFKRRDEDYHDYLKLINKVNSKVPAHRINLNRLTYTGPYLKRIAREMGQLHVSYTSECDLELAAYACKVNALAVLADDSDFLIYPGNWKYWSVRKMCKKKLTTVEYNKTALKAKFGLPDELMPLFATLAGNDIVNFISMKRFHDRLGNQSKIFLNIADFIRSTPLPLTDDNLKELAMKMNKNSEQFLEKAKNSIASYQISNYQPNDSLEADPLLDKLVKEGHTFQYPYSILKGYRMKIMPAVDDMRLYKSEEELNRSFSSLALALRKRDSGVVLSSKRDEDLKFHVLMKQSHSSKFEEIITEPEYPPPEFNVPPVDKLIFRTKGDNLDSVRFGLFQWVFFDTFDGEALRKTPIEFIPLLATVCFLIKKWELSEDEADILIYSYKNTLRNLAPRNLKCPQVLNKRAFRITHILLKLIRQTSQTLKLLGLKDFDQLFMFDGFYFQSQYKEWVMLPETAKNYKREAIQDLILLYRN